MRILAAMSLALAFSFALCLPRQVLYGADTSSGKFSIEVAVERQKDDQWLLIVKWTLFAMINAEELGITSKNIDEALKSEKPEVKRFVGNDGDYGADIGLPKDWAVRIIRRVGNYGEVYERNIGTGSKLGIPRGLNALWTQGGILYAPPIR